MTPIFYIIISLILAVFAIMLAKTGISYVISLFEKGPHVVTDDDEGWYVRIPFDGEYEYIAVEGYATYTETQEIREFCKFPSKRAAQVKLSELNALKNTPSWSEKMRRV